MHCLYPGRMPNVPVVACPPLPVNRSLIRRGTEKLSVVVPPTFYRWPCLLARSVVFRRVATTNFRDSWLIAGGLRVLPEMEDTTRRHLPLPEGGRLNVNRVTTPPKIALWPAVLL